MTSHGSTSPTAAATDLLEAPAPRWLDEYEMAAWLAFIETQGDLITALEADLAPVGLSLGDYRVFVSLSRATDNAMRMCDLAIVLQLSPSGLTRRLDGLVTAGWVERRSSVDDRRVMLAVLTDAGRRKLESAAPKHLISVRRRIIDQLDRADLDAMSRIFGKIRAAFDN